MFFGFRGVSPSRGFEAAALKHRTRNSGKADQQQTNRMGAKRRKETGKKGSGGKESARISPEKVRMIIEKTIDLAEPLCESLGIELVHVEYQREPGGRILRIYIDRPGGVRLEDCVQVNRELGDLLDVSLEDAGAYRLEVSSPGTDRPLGRPADYDRFKGNEAKIRTVTPLDGQKNFTGTIKGIAEDRVVLDTQKGTVHIPLSQIARARLVDYNGVS